MLSGHLEQLGQQSFWFFGFLSFPNFLHSLFLNWCVICFIFYKQPCWAISDIEQTERA